jgi:hypothetical protein
MALYTTGTGVCLCAFTHRNAATVSNKLLNFVNVHMIDWSLWLLGILRNVPQLSLNAVYRLYTSFFDSTSSLNGVLNMSVLSFLALEI